MGNVNFSAGKRFENKAYRHQFGIFRRRGIRGSDGNIFGCQGLSRSLLELPGLRGDSHLRGGRLFFPGKNRPFIAHPETERFFPGVFFVQCVGACQADSSSGNFHGETLLKEVAIF
jgi:hypothetical protein